MTPRPTTPLCWTTSTGYVTWDALDGEFRFLSGYFVCVIVCLFVCLFELSVFNIYGVVVFFLEGDISPIQYACLDCESAHLETVRNVTRVLFCHVHIFARLEVNFSWGLRRFTKMHWQNMNEALQPLSPFGRCGQQWTFVRVSSSEEKNGQIIQMCHCSLFL